MKMTPVLFGSDATTYTTQGLGSLKDAMSCKVSEEINGPYELEMTYPVTGRRYANLQNRCIIYCKPGPVRTAQPFRIYRITKPLNGIITVYARHISYDLSGIPVNPFTANSALTAMQGMQNNAAVACPFTFSTALTNNAAFAVTVPTGIRKVLGDGDASILGVFGGEFEWDSFTVYLRSRRGQDTGVRIAYGKNLTNIEQDENIANLVTGVIGYWTNSDGVVVQGPVVNAPGSYSYNNIDTVDFSSDFEEQPTPEQLQQATQDYIAKNNVGVPEVAISVSWLQLEQYAGYEDTATRERVSLGDTVTVSFPQLSVDATARIVKTVYDALLDQYETCDVGSVKPNIAATIAGQQQEIAALPSISTVEKIADMIAQTILGVKGGAVRLLDTNGDGYPDTLYIADNPDPNAAVKVWRFNYEGWGASQNGYNGPFEMSAALGVGMYGQFIAAGIINAALIKAGTLTAIRIESEDGSSYWDLAGGGAVFNNDSIQINSSNFQLDAQGNVNASGTFSTDNGVSGPGKNLASLSSGGLSLYRTVSSGASQVAVNVRGIGSGSSLGIIEVYGNGVRQFVLQGGLTGSSLWMFNAGGQATFQALEGEGLFSGNLNVQGSTGLGVSNKVSCRALDCWDSSQKSGVVQTSFGNLKIIAFETPEPTFADTGSGICDENGLCFIVPDPRFGEVISSGTTPRWQVTPTSQGSVWVEKRGANAIIHGEPGMTFDWMCMAPQKGISAQYAEPTDNDPPPEPNPAMDNLDAAMRELRPNAEDDLLTAWDYDLFQAQLLEV